MIAPRSYKTLMYLFVFLVLPLLPGSQSFVRLSLLTLMMCCAPSSLQAIDACMHDTHTHFPVPGWFVQKNRQRALVQLGIEVMLCFPLPSCLGAFVCWCNRAWCIIKSICCAAQAFLALQSLCCVFCAPLDRLSLRTLCLRLRQCASAGFGLAASTGRKLLCHTLGLSKRFVCRAILPW
jgi:hypothetical protein